MIDLVFIIGLMAQIIIVALCFVVRSHFKSCLGFSCVTAAMICVTADRVLSHVYRSHKVRGWEFVVEEYLPALCSVLLLIGLVAHLASMKVLGIRVNGEDA